MVPVNWVCLHCCPDAQTGSSAAANIAARIRVFTFCTTFHAVKCTRRRDLLMRVFDGDDLDLEDGRPLFSGDEEAVVLLVVGDAIEDGFCVDLLIVG